MYTSAINSEVIDPPVHCELGLTRLLAYLTEIISIGIPSLYAQT